MLPVSFAPVHIILRLPWESKKAESAAVKGWEIIADNLSKAGFSWGCSSEIDSTGRELFTADAYARDGRRFTVLADDKLSAFLELEKITRATAAVEQD
jgi:hypothetical protein